MRAKIVKIGNSQGVRIPKPLIEEAGLSVEVELRVEDGAIVIEPYRMVREGWSEAFDSMAEAGEDRLLDGDQQAATTWDGEDWEWE